MGSVNRRIFAWLSAALLLAALIAAAGCQPRTGAGAPSSARSVSKEDEEERDGPVREEDETDGGDPASGSDEESPDEAPAIDAQQVAELLIGDLHLTDLVANYNGSFDKTIEINPVQMYWSVFKWYEQDKSYRKEEKEDPNANGYTHVKIKKMEQLVAQWFGTEDLPKLVGNPQALGDPVSGELVNVDEGAGMYYFLEVDTGSTSESEVPKLKKASVDKSGIVTVKFDTEDADSGAYIRTFIVKVAVEGESYRIVGLNKGQAG